MLTPWQQQFEAYVQPYEGRVPQMYLDSRGLVTVGQGCQVGAQEAQTLLFYTPQGGPASQGDILRDYTRLQTLAKKYTPAQFQARKAAFWINADSPWLPPAEIDRLVEKRITDMTAAMQSLFPLCDSWPDAAKIATLEQIWGLGFGKYTDLFKKQIACLKMPRPDFRLAAKESAWVPAVGNQVDRNAKRYVMYIQAAQQVEKGVSA